MRLEAPFGWFAAAMLYHVGSSGLFFCLRCPIWIVALNFFQKF
jgi:hypothetical protein